MAELSARWIGSPNNSGGHYDKRFIVIHVTVSHENTGGARAVADMFADPDFNASTQYVVDNKEIYQCVRETAYAWAAGTTANKYGIHIELVGMPGQTRSEWNDAYSNAELRLAAALTRELCHKHGIPIRKVGPATLRMQGEGICGHDDVRDAWHETTHWDPGPHFPWAKFIKMVREQEDDLTPEEHKWLREIHEQMLTDERFQRYAKNELHRDVKSKVREARAVKFARSLFRKAK